jgi:hypothetical protein
MRDLISTNERAASLAVDYFIYRAAKENGALAGDYSGFTP